MRKFYKNIKISGIKVIVKFFNAIGMGKNFPQTVPGSFLVVSTTGIGDTLWGTPAIRALKETYPECYISVLTSPVGFELLKGNPYIDNLFIFKRGFLGLFLLPRLFKALRQKKIEIVFIFHASDRIVWLISFLTGTSEIMGIEKQNKDLDFILTRKISPQNTVHGIEARLNLINQIGAKTGKKTISVYLPDEDRKKVESFLRSKSIDEDSLLIGLHPGAQKPFKCWPSKNFIEAGKALVEKWGCKIIVTGNSNEKLLADEVALGIEGAISTADILSLMETAAVIERMRVFITNDTGPMHIAFALKTPTVALFSPTDPQLCGPYQAENVAVIKKALICNPCIGKKCNQPICMQQITVDEVVNAANSLLIKNKNGGKTH